MSHENVPVSLQPKLHKAVQRVIELEQELAKHIGDIAALEPQHKLQNSPSHWFTSLLATTTTSTTKKDDADATVTTTTTGKAVTFGSSVTDNDSSGLKATPFVKARRAAANTTVRLVRALTRTILIYFGCQAQGEMALLPLSLDPTEMRHRLKILCSTVFRVVKLRFAPQDAKEKATLSEWDEAEKLADSIEQWRGGGEFSPPRAAAGPPSHNAASPPSRRKSLAIAVADENAAAAAAAAMAASNASNPQFATTTRLFEAFETTERQKADKRLRDAEVLARLAILNVRNSPWYDPRWEVALQKRVGMDPASQQQQDDDDLQQRQQDDDYVNDRSHQQSQHQHQQQPTPPFTSQAPKLPLLLRRSSSAGHSKRAHHHQQQHQTTTMRLPLKLPINLSIDAVWAQVYHSKYRTNTGGNVASTYLSNNPSVRSRSPSLSSVSTANSNWSGEPIARPCRTPERDRLHEEEMEEKRRHVKEVQSWRSSRSSTASSAIRPFRAGQHSRALFAGSIPAASAAAGHAMGIYYDRFYTLEEKIAAKNRREAKRGVWKQGSFHWGQQQQQQQEDGTPKIPVLYDNPGVAAAAKKRRERNRSPTQQPQQQSQQRSSVLPETHRTASAGSRGGATTTSPGRVVVSAGRTPRPPPKPAGKQQQLAQTARKPAAKKTSTTSPAPRTRSAGRSPTRARPPTKPTAPAPKKKAATSSSSGKRAHSAALSSSASPARKHLAGASSPSAASANNNSKSKKKPEDSAAATLAAALAAGASSRYRHVRYKRRHHDAVTILAGWYRSILVCRAAKRDLNFLRNSHERLSRIFQTFGRGYLARKRVFERKRAVLYVQRFARARIGDAAAEEKRHAEQVKVAFVGWKRTLFRVVRKFQALGEFRRRKKLLDEYTEHRLFVEENDSEVLVITLQWRYDTLLQKLCVAWGLPEGNRRRGLLGMLGGATNNKDNNSEDPANSSNKTTTGGTLINKRFGKLSAAAAASSSSLRPEDSSSRLADIGLGSNSGTFPRSSSKDGGDGKNKSNNDNDDEDRLSPSMRLAAVDALKRARLSANMLRQRKNRLVVRIQKLWRGYWARRYVIEPLRAVMEALNDFREVGQLHTTIQDKLAVREENQTRRFGAAAARRNRSSSVFGARVKSTAFLGGSALLSNNTNNNNSSYDRDGVHSSESFYSSGAGGAVSGIYFKEAVSGVSSSGGGVGGVGDNSANDDNNNNQNDGDDNSGFIKFPSEIQLAVQGQVRRDAADPQWRQQYHRFLSTQTKFFAEHTKLPVVSKMP